MRAIFAIFSLLALLLLPGCGKETLAPPARLHVSESKKLSALEGIEVVAWGKADKTSVARSSGHHFLNFSGTDFSVICPVEHVGAFPGGGPAALFRNKLVEIRGPIRLHKGKPQIELSSPSQVVVINAAGTVPAPPPFELKPSGKDTWISPAGLIYKGRDPKGLTRVEHILRHANDISTRDGPHGVFDGDSKVIFPLLDEAWKRAKSKGIRPRVEGERISYTISMGRRIGYLGGRTGKARKHPPLNTVFIVMNRGTLEVITAYPR